MDIADARQTAPGQMLNPDCLEIPAPFIQLKQISEFRVQFMHKLAWLKRLVRVKARLYLAHSPAFKTSESLQSVASGTLAELICPYLCVEINFV